MPLFFKKCYRFHAFGSMVSICIPGEGPITMSGIRACAIFLGIRNLVALNLVFLFTFSGLAVLMSADIARYL